MAASLRRQGLRAKTSRRFSPISYREHSLPVSDNLLKQDFYASGPNQERVVTSRIFAPVNASFIWLWLSVYGHDQSLADLCPR